MSDPRPATHRPAAVVILAAGEGTRMRSTTPKVLHRLLGRTLLGHVLAACEPLAAGHTLVVVGHGREAVTASLPGHARSVVQHDQHGTGHATRLALEDIPAAQGTIVVLPGDAPLLTTDTLARLIAAHEASTAVATVLTTEVADPTGYGRVIRTAAGDVVRIVEHADATPAERAVREINAGVYAFTAEPLRQALGALSTDNVQGEEYLTDVIGMYVDKGLPVRIAAAGPRETEGVNDRAQLAAAARVIRDRIVTGWMRSGVAVLDPETVWIDVDVRLEPDTTVLPNVQLQGATTVAAGATIGPDCTLIDTVVGAGARVQRAHCDRAEIGADVSVGPYCYLRPGTRLGPAAKAGSFVEIKASEIGAGSKVPHLSYVGDATVGEHSNIGAGTVFVNYDGVAKHRTVIGSHARTGADNMFVAPVTVGDGAYTAAGSVIAQDVPAGALGIGRARQRNIEGWVERRRAGTAAANAAARAADPQGSGHPPDGGQPPDGGPADGEVGTGR
ncbi:MAG: bifunctional UDP-N-acetylglucosamine diphosphorylase/glucosamine-1-phosphate N-acetyltransferase GlmU [Actinobacteria bacterium]|nr:bifunctional UDP-N-acetylglucosamine diphosphorylase/glucosamine-1-phosphate N-acetyltransferase GlmU [Actinomycetota bacterium]MBI3686329.1 bifunctional UDP-N-acetylglucosamine diphosphorylase/glucosamine-1-phosphate N-acetyltransferase GlmU [Actinomycetota bacterium]